MNHYERNQEVLKLGDGNHINQPPENDEEKEIEYENCEECGQQVEYHEHYINGGLCWSCIERIGK